MKKKLLSLVLAGAMVASTSVSAFADVINSSDDADAKTNINVTGELLNDNGDKPAGRFNVTVPTTTSFTVTQEKKLITTPITINNQGEQDIEVYAVNFVDTTPEEDQQITVTKESELKSKNRSYVSLNLTGNLKTVYLKSENNTSEKTGIYKEANQTNSAINDDDLKLAVISAKKSDELKLDGKVGGAEGTIDTAVSNAFTLTLKIKKSSK